MALVVRGEANLSWWRRAVPRKDYDLVNSREVGELKRIFVHYDL